MRRVIPSALLLLAGCATGDPLHDGPQIAGSTTATRETEMNVEIHRGGGVRALPTALEAGPNDVWRATMQVYRAMEIPLALIDQPNGVMGNRALEAGRRIGERSISVYLDCGRSTGGLTTSTHQVRMSILTHIRGSAEGGSEIRTQVEATARRPGTSSPPVVCASTGRLESEITTRVQAHLVGLGG
jgi:hypothetical protein